MVIAGQIFVHDELPKVESTTELLVSRAEAPLARRTLRTAGDGRVLMAHFEQDTDGMINISGRWWSFPGAQIDLHSEFEWCGDGRLYLHDGVGNAVEGTEVNEPKVLGVLAIPSPEERRSRELLLARLMLVMVDIVLAGDPLGLETARDLSRELRHCYPELLDESL